MKVFGRLITLVLIGVLALVICSGVGYGLAKLLGISPILTLGAIVLIIVGSYWWLTADTGGVLFPGKDSHSSEP